MRRSALLLALLSLACGGARGADSGAASVPAPATAVTTVADGTPSSSGPAAAAAGSYAGEYTTDVTLVRSACRGIEVESRPTTVTQGSNAQSLSITHGPLRFDARLRDTGAFSARPVSTTIGSQTHTLTLSGTFSERALSAEVRATVEEPGQRPCDYLVRWAGTKQ
jgi:hypothetical protein